MDHSFQIRRLPVLDDAKFVMENMVYGHVKCLKEWVSRNKEKLCFCCLDDDHYSKDSKRRRKCGVQDCDKGHHKLLHSQKKDDPTKRSGDGASGQDAPRSNQIIQGDGPGDQTLSTVSDNDSQVAVRTIPVILSNDKNKLVVNALLDDGSTKSYVNSDVAFQLGTDGTVKKYKLGFSMVNWKHWM